MRKQQVFAAALGLVCLLGCRGGKADPDGSGTIECTEVQVAPLVPGRILRLGPEEGARVTLGEEIGLIDEADLRLRSAEARASLHLAEAQLRLVRADPRQEDVERLRQMLREARAAATAAAVDLARIEKLHAEGSAPQKQLDDAGALAERTTAAAAAAEQTLARLMAGSREEEIQVAAAQVELAKARLATAEKLVQDCRVLAPMEGTVTTRNREPGEIVSAGTTLLTIARLDPVWLSVYIPENRLGAVKLGQAAQIRVDGLSEPIQGTVTYVAAEAEFTPRNVQTPEQRAKLVYRVKITVANPQGVLKPGMPADGYLGLADGN